jgi:hypothetical protein
MTHYSKEMEMKITTGRRAAPPRNHFVTARRWPLALLCGLLLLAGSAFAQDDSARRAPAPEASETQKAPDPNEAVTPVSGSAPARTTRPGGSSVDGDIVFTSPGGFLYPRDIRLSDSYGVLRFFAADALTTSPAGAAVQLFGNNADAFNGQLYLDSGAHNSAALIFRTAKAGEALAERMRVRADGKVSIGTTQAPQGSMLRVVGGSSAHGVAGETGLENGAGVYGSATGNNGSGVLGQAFSNGGTAVEGFAYGPNGTGLYGGVSESGGVAVRGEAFGVNTMAGVFIGNVQIHGNLAKAGGSFKIDHPLDPTNKYLSHSFVESPDMMNIYNGNVTTDARGEVVVELPSYFTALNRQYRYQLTVVGQFAQAIVASEIENNRFTIKTNKPRVKVSWQVTGVRQDAYAEAHRIPVEEAKPAEERGTYLHPQAFGQPAEKGVNHAQRSAAEHTPTNRQSGPRDWR